MHQRPQAVDARSEFGAFLDAARRSTCTLALTRHAGHRVFPGSCVNDPVCDGRRLLFAFSSPGGHFGTMALRTAAATWRSSLGAAQCRPDLTLEPVSRGRFCARGLWIGDAVTQLSASAVVGKAAATARGWTCGALRSFWKLSPGVEEAFCSSAPSS
jgi:hypothetical protein